MLKATSSIVNVSQITGVLPVVNGGTGVTTSTGTGSTVLSAAPTLSGNVTLSTGNLIVASGQGIDFSATPGTGTSELLDDYEEGTWTPGIVSSAGTITSFTSSGNYVKIGNQVTVQGTITLTDVGTASGFAIISDLPFTVMASITAVPFIVAEFDLTGFTFRGYLNQNNTTGSITTLTNGNLTFTNGSKFIFTVTYLSA